MCENVAFVYLRRHVEIETKWNLDERGTDPDHPVGIVEIETKWNLDACRAVSRTLSSPLR